MNGLKNGLQEGLISGLNNGLADGLTNGLTNGLFVNEYPFDIDANKFLNAANINDIRIKKAINKLVINLKAANIWNKMKAIYPMVGGTATAHKFNLKNPADTDAAFRLNFVGGGTHSSNGYQPNGTNGYANTFLTSSTALNLNSTHLSYYSRTDSNGTEVEIGNQSVSAYLIIEARTSNTTYFLVNTNTISGVADSNSAAFYLANRTASNVTNGFRNSTKIFNSSVASTALPLNTIYIGALQNASNAAQYFSTKQCAFASIGDGLSDAEALALYNAVNAFQVTLARNV